MGLLMSVMGKGGLPSVQSLVTEAIYKFEANIENFEQFHIAVLDIFNSLNSALPGRHYDVPPTQEVKGWYEKWKEEKDEVKRKDMIVEFMKKSINLNKLDNTTMIVGLATPPAAMAVKRAGENVPQIRMIKVIPDVIFVPSATLLALVSVKLSRRLSLRKHIAES